MKTIAVQALQEVLANNPNTQLVDVREGYEFDICSITGSKNIPMGEIADRIAELDKQENLLVVCKSGKRAAAVANLLVTDYGFNQIAVLEGGVLAYIEEVDPTLEAY